MKLLFIQPQTEYDSVAEDIFPFGYASLISILTKHGYRVDILFPKAYRLSDKHIAQKIKKTNAQIVAIGGMFPYLRRTELLVNMVKQCRPELKVVLGGMMVTYCPELALQKTNADFGIRGEGELSLLELVENLENNKDHKQIKGLVYREDSKIVNNGISASIDINEIPMPDWKKYPMNYYFNSMDWYLKNEFYDIGKRSMFWMISRGCYGRCNFCSSGSKPRHKSVDKVIEEVTEIKERFNPDGLYFCDNVAGANKTQIKKLFIAFLDKNLCFKDMFLNLRADLVDKELLDILKKVGCRTVGYGLESANNHILKSMGKNITVEQYIEAIQYTQEAGIRPSISCMFGQPSETLKEAVNTLKIFLKTSEPTLPYDTPNGFGMMVTFPGTKIYEYAVKNGYIKDDSDYYEKYFNNSFRGTINYTKYTRRALADVSRIGNALSKWNYHRTAEKYYENRLKELARQYNRNDTLALAEIFVDRNCIDLKKLNKKKINMEIFDRKIEKILNDCKNKRVVIYGITNLSEYFIYKCKVRDDIDIVGILETDIDIFHKKRLNGSTIFSLETINNENHGVVIVCANTIDDENEMVDRISSPIWNTDIEIVRLLSRIYELVQEEKEVRGFIKEIYETIILK